MSNVHSDDKLPTKEDQMRKMFNFYTIYLLIYLLSELTFYNSYHLQFSLEKAIVSSPWPSQGYSLIN